MAMESGNRTDCQIQIEGRFGLLMKRRQDLGIFKVPYKLRKVNEAAYSPLTVSIAPYHANTGARPFLSQKLAMERDHERVAKEDDNWQTNMASLLQQVLAKNDDHILYMEEHKLRYMLFFIGKTQSPDRTLYKFRRNIEDAAVEGRLSCTEYINFGRDELVDMMMVNGCFVLELFIRSWFKDSSYGAASESLFGEDKPCCDPIFLNSWMLPTLRRDLALIENQIPLFILQNLFDIFNENFQPRNISSNTSHGKLEIPSIALLALSFFRPDLKLNKLEQEEWKAKEERIHDRYPTDESFYHLLDLLHKLYRPRACNANRKETQRFEEGGTKLLETGIEDKIIEQPGESSCHLLDLLHKFCRPTACNANRKETRGFREGATKLLETGIEIVKNSASEENFLDVVFDKEKGDIKIPQLRIDEEMESLLSNLIAFEQCSAQGKHYVSSYAILMKSLLSSATDVELLKEKEIIIDNLGGNEYVLTFFKKISMGIGDVQEDFCFGKLCEDVYNYKMSWWHCHRITAFCKVRSHTYWEALKRDYFSNPWRIIGFIAAVILLGLTGLQTWYTVY